MTSSFHDPFVLLFIDALYLVKPAITSRIGRFQASPIAKVFLLYFDRTCAKICPRRVLMSVLGVQLKS
jgi:hypothetical protein